MHADELRSAVNRIVEVLAKADIQAVVRQFRAAKGDQRTVAAARLGHAGAVIMENFDKLSDTEKLVVRCMHLDSLGDPAYWQSLIGSAHDPKQAASELVHLYSRAMFASSHLPNLVSLLGTVDAARPSDEFPLGQGEGRLRIRLADAGERAADPDRVARSVDGVDMLYSACASIARKPAMDLKLEGVTGDEFRDIHFTGEHDSISAVIAVIESIPDALQELDPDEEFDLSEVVASLPIFDDLRTLADLGNFAESDLRDISETMHQGAMLALESGVVLVHSPTPDTGKAAAANTNSAPVAQPVQPAQPVESRPVTTPTPTPAAPANTPAAAPVPAQVIPVAASQAPAAAPAPETDNSANEAGDEPPMLTRRANSAEVTELPQQPKAAPAPAPEQAAPAKPVDKHYEQYLRERRAMQGNNEFLDELSKPVIKDPVADDQQRKDAVEELLKTLSRNRGSG